MPPQKKWYQKKGILIFFGLLGAIIILIIASSFYLVKKVNNFQGDGVGEQNNDLGVQLTQQLKRQKKYQTPEGKNAQNYTLGATSSPRLTIVEFSDFTCPYSKNVYSKIRRIGIEHEQDIKIIFRDYPADEESMTLSMAANCAGDQGLFWSMHDKLFQNQGEVTAKQLPRLAQQIGADKEEFRDCMDQNKFRNEIVKDVEAGDKMGIEGTPTLFLNGYKVSGDIPYSVLETVVEGFIQEPN